jgi:hypothetical protein
LSVIKPGEGISKGGYIYAPTEKALDPYYSTDLQLQCGMFRNMVKGSFSDKGGTVYEIYEWLSKGADDGKPRKMAFSTVREILELGVKNGYFIRKSSKEPK